MKLGVDIEKIDRFRGLSEEFLEQTFTPDEVKYAKSHTLPEMHLCGAFCAKEAMKKTLSSSHSLQEISVSHTPEGKPFILVKGKRAEKVALSISHTDEYAVAVVVNEDE